MVIRIRAGAAFVALALWSVAVPSAAAPQEASTGGLVDAAGWSLKAGKPPDKAPIEAVPLRPTGQIEKTADPLEPPDKAADAEELPPEAVTRVTNWVIASGDNGGVPFMVIDKITAQVFVFGPQGLQLGATPALLGMTPGDESAPGVGDRELSDIKPEDRTTPAGRFVAKFGLASGRRQVLWVDYPTAISLHAVVTTKKKERRLQRLKSPTPEDNRITYGCINIPAAFYTKVVRPLFKDTAGVVYILPEIKTLKEAFLAYYGQERSSTH